MLWYFGAALGLGGFEDHVGDGAVAAHEDVVGESFLFTDEVIVMAHLADIAGDDFCQAFATVAVAATVTECEARVQASLEQG